MRHPTIQTAIELGEFADLYLRPFSSVSHLCCMVVVKSLKTRGRVYSVLIKPNFSLHSESIYKLNINHIKRKHLGKQEKFISLNMGLHCEAKQLF